jgi:hypothetical protein
MSWRDRVKAIEGGGQERDPRIRPRSTRIPSGDLPWTMGTVEAIKDLDLFRRRIIDRISSRPHTGMVGLLIS